MRVLLKVMKEQHPTYLAVTWDLSRDTFRREMYSDYKAFKELMLSGSTPNSFLTNSGVNGKVRSGALTFF